MNLSYYQAGYRGPIGGFAASLGAQRPKNIFGKATPQPPLLQEDNSIESPDFLTGIIQRSCHSGALRGDNEATDGSSDPRKAPLWSITKLESGNTIVTLITKLVTVRC